MTRVLVTGGTGGLGREVVSRLSNGGYTVRVMSRGKRAASTPAQIEWAQADMESGTGLREAVADVDVIVHAATDPRNKPQHTDAESTRLLLEQVRTAGVAHFIYISIVGVERIPSYTYYKIKATTEQVVRESAVPWSTLPITQFHSLIDFGLNLLARKLPVMLVPGDLQFQSIDTGEAADQVCAVVKAEPGGLLPDVGGPEVLRAGDMARIWMKARGMRRPMLPLYLPGKSASGLRQGFNTCPDHRQGKITWAEWVTRQYGNSTEGTKGMNIHERHAH